MAMNRKIARDSGERHHKIAEMRTIPDMKLSSVEMDFLSAWAREEKAPDPYLLPAHQLQAAYQVPSVSLIRAIKGWARSEGKHDEDIFNLCGNPSPQWPWSTTEASNTRLEEIASAHQGLQKV